MVRFHVAFEVHYIHGVYVSGSYEDGLRALLGIKREPGVLCLGIDFDLPNARPSGQSPLLIIVPRIEWVGL
jgi:hypothetical protein